MVCYAFINKGGDKKNYYFVSGGNTDGQVKFSVSAVEKIMKKEAHEVYTKLSELQYNDHGVGGQRDDGTVNTVSVEFSSQIFHIYSRAGFSLEDLDRACDFLCKKVKEQEESNVKKLHLLHGVLQSIKSSDSDSDDTKKHKESTLRELIQAYFNNKQLNMSELCTTHSISILPLRQELTSTEKQQIEYDVNLFVFKHGVQFTGRAIARIFYGLKSPLFPDSKPWKRSGLWGKYLKVNFNQLCNIATKKLEELKSQAIKSASHA